MGTTYRFIEAPGEGSDVLAWFRALPDSPSELVSEAGHLFHFRTMGPIAMEHGAPVSDRSPLVNVFVPRVRRGVLWTAGEVHFLATPLRSFPALQRISFAFKRWLSRLECIYEGPSPRPESEWAYFLEGSLRNHDSPIYALPSGMEALRAGRYFVSDDETDGQLDALCAALRLRGLTPLDR